MGKFVSWHVDDKEYRLVLNGRAICDVEEKVLGGDPITSAIGTFGPGVTDPMRALPSLSRMLKIIQIAAQKLNHGLDFKAVTELYDKYCEEGGNVMTLYMDVYVKLFDGFFARPAAMNAPETPPETPPETTLAE